MSMYKHVRTRNMYMCCPLGPLCPLGLVRSQGVEPDIQTFNAVLRAAAKAGDPKAAESWFERALVWQRP